MQSLFAELEAARKARKLPPVQRWQPANVGRIDIRIAADGTWYHEGRPILRQPLVDLFATVLRRDADGYHLVTPAEKLAIEVEDAPFLGVRLARDGEGDAQRLLLTTNVGDHVPLDAAHRLTMRERAGQQVPYVEVRDGLEARVLRSVFYELVELGRPVGRDWCVRSDGIEHVLGPAD